MDKRQRRLNVAVTFILLAVTLMLGASIYYKSYIRFYESLKDLVESGKYYIGFTLNISIDSNVTVTEKSNVFDFSLDLPETFDGLQERTVEYGEKLVDEENALEWFLQGLEKFAIASKFIVLLLPIVVGLVLVIIQIYKKPNNKYGKETVPLRVFKRISNGLYQPFRSFFIGYKAFLQRNGKIVGLLILLWIFNLNLSTIAIEFLAYYIYFASSFEIINIYMQFVKLVIDLQVFFTQFPWYLLLPFVWKLFSNHRERIGIDRLMHYEAKNCGFIKSLPIVTMICGSMGKGKTTVLTDITLCQNKMFRQEAYKRILETDMKFPNFPWILFEQDLKEKIQDHSIYNLATTKNYVRYLQSEFESKPCSDYLYGYDYIRYGLTYNDKLKVYDIFEILETYALLYFIYVVSSSLIISNYSIRDDAQKQDLGNLPLWSNNFFGKRRPKRYRYSHILDYDILRLGKKMIEDNENAGSFEFGVVALSEIGKERGNNLELKEVKKNDVTTNQKNDGFNAWLKMSRHAATVDNYPFIKILCDEQRPESWGADARDLCDIIRIIERSEIDITLPFFTLEDMICEWAINGFERLYQNMRFLRGDNTLLVYVLKNITAKLNLYRKRIYNRFGYSVVDIEKEKGTLDGARESRKYYLMSYKIYGDRFASNCFADYFNSLAEKSNVGINDYTEYADTTASVEELRKQNSYFIEGLYKDEGGDK